MDCRTGNHCQCRHLENREEEEEEEDYLLAHSGSYMASILRIGKLTISSISRRGIPAPLLAAATEEIIAITRRPRNFMLNGISRVL